MIKARYVGPPVTNWYGRDLMPGDVLTIPEHKLSERWERVEDGPAPELEPRRRGRPRKATA